jgi:RNase adapter protein RapZ
MRNPILFVIVTGLSGSGKTSALRTLEDLGFYAVDNLPADLLQPFAELVAGGHAEITRAALGMDVRDRESFHRLPEVVRALRASGHRVEVLFFTATRETLLKRFSETRRVHPLDPTLPLAESLNRERDLMQPLHDLADLVIDTTDTTVHRFRHLLRERYAREGGEGGMTVTLLSFGYKFGIPKEADLVLDVRFLPNPYFVDGLRDRDGRDPEVREYLRASPQAAEAMGRMTDFVEKLLPLYLGEGRGYLTVAIGCTGGQHRSVAVVERLAETLKGTSKIKVQVRHRELSRE